MTTTPTSGAADLPEALRVPLDSLHADAGYLCGRLLNGSLTQEQVVESIRRRIDAAKLAALTAQAISKAPDHVAEVGNMVEQAISAEPAGAGYAELPESLMLAVDRWFADNTGLGGCSGKDVRGLAELFYDVTYEGGRESVDDALAIVESFGPGIGGLNDTYARQVLLAAEVTRLRGIYKSAVAGRASMRDALRASHGQAPAQPTAAGCLQHLTTLQEQAGMYADDFTPSPQAAQQAPAGATECRLVSHQDLKALAASINGDCYMGEEWEKACVTGMLAAPAAPSTPASPTVEGESK